MLFNKLSEADQIKEAHSSLSQENEILRTEKRDLLQRISEMEKSNQILAQDLLSQKEDIKTYLQNISKLKEDNEKKTYEITSSKDSATKLKYDFDHEVNRFESETKRYEDQVSGGKRSR
jgi:chromosome segregation ATPase